MEIGIALGDLGPCCSLTKGAWKLTSMLWGGYEAIACPLVSREIER